MAYDSNRDVTVLFGGHDVTQYADTWEYDGTVDCADPDCDGLPCATGTCSAGTCQ